MKKKMFNFKHKLLIAIFAISLFSAFSNASIFKNFENDNKYRFQSKKLPTIEVAVVGAGIGGSSLSYFLREFEKKYKGKFNLCITMYEKEDRVGGRIYSKQLWSQLPYKIELGASVFIESNFYIKTLVEKMNIPRTIIPINNFKNPVFWNGKKITFNSNNCKGNIHGCFAKRYGLNVLKKAIKLSSEAIGRFNRIYRYQNASWSTKKVEKQLNLLRLDDYTTKTLSEVYKKFVGTDNQKSDTLFAKEYINGMLHFTYNNDIWTVNGLAGLIGTYFLSNITDDVWLVKDGNDIIVKKLIEYSEVDLQIENKVSKIEKNIDGTQKVTSTDFIGKHSKNFDVVVLAAPNALSNIEISQDLFKKEKTKFVDNTQLFVFGDQNNNYFGLNKTETQNIGRIADSNKMKDIKKFSAMMKMGNKLKYALFPRGIERKKIIKELFENVNDLFTREHTITAYPNFVPTTKYDSFNPFEGLYYINAIEDVASSVEVSCVGAKNVALLIEQFLASKMGLNNKIFY